MNLEEKKLQEEIVYECPIFKVAAGEVLLPNGKTACRNRVLHTGGCGVLPLTTEGDVLLVKQYRYGIENITLEIPAGKLEAGEDPKACALRELSEEIGAHTDGLIELGTIAVTPAYDSEIIYIYMAHCDECSAQHLDEDEFLNVHKIKLSDAVKMVLDGTITDAKTQIALLKVNEMMKNG